MCVCVCVCVCVKHDTHLLLADVVHGSGLEWQPDVLHLAGLQQVVPVAALLFQLRLDGRHLLLQLGQLPVSHTHAGLLLIISRVARHILQSDHINNTEKEWAMRWYNESNNVKK